MSKKTSYDLDEFRSLIKAGKTKQEIIEKMQIKGYTQFASLELRLFKTDNHVYTIPSGSSVKKPEDNIIIVGKKGNITISTKTLAGSIFKVNDKFKISIKDKKIVLTLIDEVKEE